MYHEMLILYIKLGQTVEQWKIHLLFILEKAIKSCHWFILTSDRNSRFLYPCLEGHRKKCYSWKWVRWKGDPPRISTKTERWSKRLEKIFNIMIIIVLQYCSQTVLPSSDGHLGTMLFTSRRTNFFMHLTPNF